VSSHSTIIVKNLGSGLEPYRLLEVDAQHGPPVISTDFGCNNCNHNGEQAQTKISGRPDLAWIISTSLYL